MGGRFSDETDEPLTFAASGSSVQDENNILNVRYVPDVTGTSWAAALECWCQVAADSLVVAAAYL